MITKLALRIVENAIKNSTMDNEKKRGSLGYLTRIKYFLEEVA